MLRLLPCVALIVLGLGCAEVVQSRIHPALAGAEPIDTVAVVAFRLGGRLAAAEARPAGSEPAEPDPHVAAELITRHVTEALAARGVSVIPAGDLTIALGQQPATASDVARLAQSEFGADAVVLGVASRFVERSGQAAGTLRPASVAFEVTLHAAPGGQPLWTGVFDETQHALSENVLRAGRYPGGGTRWLTADELARWGAQEVARVMPLGR